MGDSETYAKLYNEERLRKSAQAVEERLSNPKSRAEAEQAHRKFGVYVAYGSNINKDQMALRCPASKATDAHLLEKGELTFRSNHGWAGVADIGGVSDGGAYSLLTPAEPAPNSVAVQLYTLELKDMIALDVFEGYVPDGDSFYTRTYFDLTLPNGEKFKAMTYRMTGGEPAPPDQLYADVIREGYKQRGLPLSMLEDALKRFGSGG